MPPQVGIYGYLLGGVGYALFGSSRQLAVGPTSAISLMVAGTVGEMAGGDVIRYAQIASLAGFAVALLCFASWLLRLSTLVRLISDSVDYLTFRYLGTPEGGEVITNNDY